LDTLAITSERVSSVVRSVFTAEVLKSCTLREGTARPLSPRSELGFVKSSFASELMLIGISVWWGAEFGVRFRQHRRFEQVG
jgi:hypothetical protein